MQRSLCACLSSNVDNVASCLQVLDDIAEDCMLKYNRASIPLRPSDDMFREKPHRGAQIISA